MGHKMNIIYTDVFNIMIVHFCSPPVADTKEPIEDILVLSREKTMSKYHRRVIRDQLARIGFEDKHFKEFMPEECYGEDVFQPGFT